MANFRISLDLQRHETQLVLSCKQTDVGSKITVAAHESGVPYPLTADNYAVFVAKKEDDTEIVNDCTIDLINNRIVYEITGQTLASIGIVRCELQIFGYDREQIATPTFNILVREAVLGETDIASTSEYGVLNDIIEDVRRRLEYGDFDGADGITPLVRINESTKVWEVSYNNGQTYESLGVYSVGADGKDGENGDDGVGILTITKTATSGLVDTYTVKLTDNSTYTFTVTNGEKGDGIPPITSADNGRVLSAQDGVARWVPADKCECGPELPVISVADEGKVLTAEGGVWLAKEPEKELPEVNEYKDGYALMVEGGVWVAKSHIVHADAPLLVIEGTVATATTTSLFGNGVYQFYADGKKIGSSTLAGQLDLSTIELAEGIHSITATLQVSDSAYRVSDHSNAVVYVVGELVESLPTAEGVAF